MPATNFVMNRYLTAGLFKLQMSSEVGENEPDPGDVALIAYTPFGTDQEKHVLLEIPIHPDEGPEPGDIVVEFPTHVVWMPPEHFTDQFCEV